MALRKIVITGGPGGGKSDLMKRLPEVFGRLGVRAVYVPEAARTIYDNSWRPKWSELSEEGQFAFQSAIMEASIRMENAFAKLDYENKPTVMIMDRGTLDGRAFLSDNNWTRLLVAERTNEAALLARYDAVIHMTTAAEGAEEYYVNDPVRNETPEQAREIDARLVRAYAAHPRRYIVTSGADFGVKISTALGHVEKEVTALIAETMGFK